MTALLEMKKIRKIFSGIVALDDVSLIVGPGEIHSVVGENGAGKSTLMKILSGVYRKDGGSIFLKGKEVEIQNPNQAFALGIGVVHQNLDLIPELTVAENIFMNRFPQNGPLIDYKKLNERCIQELKKLDAYHISPDSTIRSLSVADQQLVAIVKALSYNASILILDEPTSSLSEKEAAKLFENIRKLKEKGVSTIFISHHLDEIFSIAERVTVLRDGKMVGSWGISELNEEKLVRYMIGRKITEMFPKLEVTHGKEVIRVEHISVPGKVKDVSFSVKSGEILGIGGLVGAGRSELVKAIFGAIQRAHGDVFIYGKKIKIRNPKDAVRNGIALIPEDRREEGCITEFTIKENITLANLKAVKRGLVFLSEKKEQNLSTNIVTNLKIKASSINQQVKTLSGGNQQKVVLGKWFSLKPQVIILDEPTKGIDVGAKSEIHLMLSEFAKNGMAVIVISSELPELLGISDRIIVLSKGRKTGEFNRNEFSSEKIMLAATKAS